MFAGNRQLILISTRIKILNLYDREHIIDFQVQVPCCWFNIKVSSGNEQKNRSAIGQLPVTTGLASGAFRDLGHRTTPGNRQSNAWKRPLQMAYLGPKVQPHKVWFHPQKKKTLSPYALGCCKWHPACIFRFPKLETAAVTGASPRAPRRGTKLRAGIFFNFCCPQKVDIQIRGDRNCVRWSIVCAPPTSSRSGCQWALVP